MVGATATSLAAAKPRPKAVAACDLLTMEEVTAALPALPVPMGPTPGDAATAARIGKTYSSCTWGEVSPITQDQARVQVNLELKAPKSSREIVRINSTPGYALLTGAEAKGLGNVAGLYPQGNEFTIEVVKGKALMRIDVEYSTEQARRGQPVTTGPVPDRAAALELARKAVARIPGGKG